MSLAALLKQTGLVDDTGLNVPEHPDTLALQQRALREGRQRVQMFPLGTRELPLPEGMARTEARRGIFHYDPTQITAEEIARASEAGRENEVLGLGPANKADVLRRVAQGEPIAAVAEVAQDGREVKSAMVTPSTAAAAALELEQRRAPEHRVVLRRAEEIIAGREGGDAAGGLAQLLAESEPAQREDAPQGGYLADKLKRAGRSLAQVPGQIVESVGTLADAAIRIANAAGQDEVTRETGGGTEERLAAIRKAMQTPTPIAHDVKERGRKWAKQGRDLYDTSARFKPDTRRDEELTAQAADSTGSLAGALLAPGRLLAKTAAGALLNSQQQAEEARHTLEQRGATPEETDAEALTQFVLNLPAGALEAIPWGRAFKRWGGKKISEAIAAKYGKDALRRITGAVLGQAAAEGTEEALQQVWGNATAAAGYDPERKLTEGAGNAFAVGAMMGAGVAGTTQGAAELAHRISEGRAATDDARESGQTREQPQAADGIAALIANVESEDGDAVTQAAGRREAVAPRTASEPVVVENAPMKKPKLGKPAESIAAAINARPDEAFKAELTEMNGADVDLVSQLARYGEETAKTEDDFAAFAERMREKFGDRVEAYLPAAWDAVSGGRPVRDLVPTSDPLRVEGAWQRAAQWGRLFWEGSADVLRRAGVNSLAAAVDQHVDFADRNLAMAWAPIKAAVEPFQSIGGVMRRGRAKLVFDEFEAFFRARENGRMDEAAGLLEQARPETRRLIAGVQQMFRFTGAENRRLGVRVRDRTGALRPIGYLGADNFPRMLREDVQAVLRDPSSNPQLWEQMRAELVNNRNVESREDAATFVREAAPTETSSDHFGSLEKARAARLPESWYEYRFERVIPRYVASWAERTAQIEAFGQKIAETDRDAFDVAADATRNPELRRYIEATRDHAYRVNRLNPTARRAMGNVTSATTALFLSNPYSTIRNLIGGTAQTVNQFGLWRSWEALRGAWHAIPEAEAMGAIKADVADLLFHDDAGPKIRKATGVALKLAGFSAVEQFIRAHNFLTAKTFLRDSLRAFGASPESRQSLQAVAFFRRHGLDAAKLARENLHGPETERFLRGAVREIQGSYRYSQVPLFTDGPLGKFLLQFARWGTMATRFHALHSIAPAIVGEQVPVRGRDGKTTMRRVRTLAPLLRSPLVAMVAGATTFALREALFGVGRSDATWDEVFRTLDDDDRRGVELAFGHMASDIIMGGTFGALTDYASMLRDAAERHRFKSPVEPPAASVLKEFGLLAYKQAQQGTLSAQDLREFTSRVVTAYRYGSAMAYRFSDAIGAEWAAARRHQAEQDRSFVRNAGRRFAEEAGHDVPGVTGGLPRVTANSPGYDDLEDALLSGDAAEVRRAIARRMAGARSDKERAERLRQLRASALGRQPMRPGGQSGPEDRDAFRAWARRRLSPEDVRRIEDVQRRYFTTGVRAGLFPAGAMERYAQP